MSKTDVPTSTSQSDRQTHVPMYRDLLDRGTKSIQDGLNSAAEARLTSECFGPRPSLHGRLTLVQALLQFDQGVSNLQLFSRRAQRDAEVTLTGDEGDLGPTLVAFAKFAREQKKETPTSLIAKLAEVTNSPVLSEALLADTPEGATLREQVNRLARKKAIADACAAANYGND